MKIEVLFPEICNLYGDLANIRYLKECIPEVEIIKTSLQDRPGFLEEEMDLVYMGTTTENGQHLALNQLRLYRQQILDKVDEGTRFLITGNAMELFGERIEEDGVEEAVCLGLFPGIARRSSVNRFNSLFVGEFHPNRAEGTEEKDKSGGEAKMPAGKKIEVVGFMSQFGHMYDGENEGTLEKMALFNSLRGPGMNMEQKNEGVRINNFLATYVIGPLLILNPPFTKWFIKDYLGYPIEKLAYEEAAMDSYTHRLKEYKDPKTGLYYWGGTNQRPAGY